jgi:hypothetical protein
MQPQTTVRSHDRMAAAREGRQRRIAARRAIAAVKAEYDSAFARLAELEAAGAARVDIRAARSHAWDVGAQLTHARQLAGAR